jgi:hypothetical protein
LWFGVCARDDHLVSSAIIVSTRPPRWQIDVRETRAMPMTVLAPLATKADVAESRAKLADGPGKTHAWCGLAALLGACARDLAGLAQSG